MLACLVMMTGITSASYFSPGNCTGTSGAFSLDSHLSRCGAACNTVHYTHTP